FYSSRRRHTRWPRDWSSDVCSSDLIVTVSDLTYCAWLWALWITLVTATLLPGVIPLAGLPSTVTPASLPAVAVPEPEPEVVQYANAALAIARTPTTLSAVSTRFLVNLLLNID